MPGLIAPPSPIPAPLVFLGDNFKPEKKGDVVITFFFLNTAYFYSGKLAGRR